MYSKRIIIPAILLPLIFFISGMAADLHPPELLPGAAGGGYDPTVSPNGRYLAFTSKIEGNEDIWLLDLEKKEKWKVTRNTSADYSPCFSGNDKLLFVSTRSSGGGEIYRSDLKGKNVVRMIGGGGYFDSPTVSPDGKIIAYVHSEVGNRVYIYFHDIRTGESAIGPAGLEPSFSPSGQKIVFLNIQGNEGNPVPAIYDLNDSSLTEVDTRSMVISNPSFSDDGRSVLCAVHDDDTDGDGAITRNDYPRLIEYSLDDTEASRWLYPGYRFGDPTTSQDGRIYAVSERKEIYALSETGAVGKLESAHLQTLQCDSLLSHPGDRGDSLFTAAVCLSSFYHYPDSCGDFLLTAADHYSTLGMTDLAQSILTGIDGRVTADLAALAELKKSEIAFKAGKKGTVLRAWREAYETARGIIDESWHSAGVIKEAYLDGIRVSYASGRFDEGTELIVEGLLRFTGDEGMTALLEIWRLRYKASDYSGNPLDLVPLYVEYLTRFSGQQAMADTVVEDLVALTRDLNVELAVNALDNIQRRYPALRKLGVACLYEQGLRLERSGQPEIARWKYEEIIDDFGEYPDYRFQAFSNLGELRLRSSDAEGTEVYFDSARVYLNYAPSAAARTEFLRRYSRLKAMQGYTVLGTDPAEAGEYFRQSYQADPDNVDAVWGLAGSLSVIGKESRWENADRIFSEDYERTYFRALREITRYEEDGRVSFLNNARKHLLKALDQDRKYEPSYLALGYIDCMLEILSDKSLGLYEEAVEVSMTGVSLSCDGTPLESAFLLNLGEAYYGLGQYRKAYESYIRAMAFLPETTAAAGTDAVLLKLADSAFQIDSLERAEQIYRDIYSRASNSANAEWQALTSSKLGLIYQSRDMYVEALEYYELALPYYSSRDDPRMTANILKCEAICYNRLGEQERASAAVGEALALFEKAGHRRIYDDRIKLIIWPFGLTVPIISMEGMNYGGSVYPAGLTDAANRVLLTRMATEDADVMKSIGTLGSIKEILMEGGEKQNTVEIHNSLGRLYYQTGYLDSAAASFRTAYRIAKDKDDYAGAHMQLTNRAACLLSRSDTRLLESEIEELEDLRSECDRLGSMIPITYGAARAGLKNIAGAVEFLIAMADMDESAEVRDMELEAWMADLRAEAIRTISQLEEAWRFFGEGISEVALGTEPALVASMSLNEALVSEMLADEDGYNTSMARAVNSAGLSGSEGIYADVIGVEGLLTSRDSLERKAMLTGAIEIYESFKPGPLLRQKSRLINEIYRQAIEASLNDGDSLAALGLLERRKGLELACIMAANPAKYPESQLLKVNITQMEHYRSELSRLKGEKRRLTALGIAGRIEMKKTDDDILEARSRFLKAREEIKSMAPSLASALFLDIDSPEIICRNIPAGEICLVPIVLEGGIVVWACGSAGIEPFVLSNDNGEVPERLRTVIEEYDVVTIVESEGQTTELLSRLDGVFSDKKMKLAYSLNEAYGRQRAVVGKLDGVGLIAFDGGVIDAQARRQLGATPIDVDSGGMTAGSGEYGWLVIDGQIHRDNRNPLLSYWERAGGAGDTSVSRFHLYELRGESAGPFGVIVTKFPEISSPAEKRAMLKVFLEAGARAVINIPEEYDAKTSTKIIEDFFENLRSMSPLESFAAAGGPADILSGNGTSTLNYYGNSGWGPDERKGKAIEWYQESVYAGYSAVADNNWREAVRYFERAVRQSELAGLSAAIGEDVTRKMVAGYIKLGDSEKALTTQSRLIDQCKGDTSCLKGEWREYIRIASESGNSEKEISGWRILLDLALMSRDFPLVQQCYLEMAEYYLDHDNLGEAGKMVDAPAWSSGEVADSSILARRELIRGRISLLAGRYRKAESSFDAAGRQYEACGDMKGKHETLMYEAEALRETGRLMGEKTNLIEALDYYRDSGDSPMIIECLQKLAVNYRDSGRLSDALDSVDDILKYQPGNSEALVLQSDLLRRRGNLDSAYDVALRAIGISEQRRSPDAKVQAHYNMGKVLQSRGNTGAASDEFLLAMEFARDGETGSSVDIIEYKYSMLEKGNRDSILAAVAGRTGEPFMRNLCLYQMALESIGEGDRNRAADYFEQLLSSDNRKTERYLYWRSLYHLGLMTNESEKGVYFSEADSAYRRFPPEPGYAVAEYALDVGPQDLYYAMADSKIDGGDIDKAIVLEERAAVSEISAAYLSRGSFDKYENDFLDSCQVIVESGASESIGQFKSDFLREHPLYRPLWGEPEITDLDFTGDLDQSQALMRFYVQPDFLKIVYMDADTVAYKEVAIDREEMEEDINGLSETMRNQRKADSLLEEWYRMLVGEFEDMIFNREQLGLIPDGPLLRFPLEALKMPGGDYLGEMFSTVRGTDLQPGFPSSSSGRYLPCVDEIGDSDSNRKMEIILSVSEAVGDCQGGEAGRVRFVAGAVSSDAEWPEGEIVCFTDTANHGNGTGFSVELLNMRKKGYARSIQTLWPITDQAAAFYYWTFLDKLRQGKSVRESQRDAKSFLYGRYRGSAYYWPSHALYSLD
jgi:tetratricopeptide (TPR) repeat protein